MPRTQSSNLTTIFEAYHRRDTLDLYLANNTVKRLSRGAVTRGGNTYLNYISSVGDLSASIETAIDRISINCQNVNSELGFDLASDLRLLDYALADYGKIYQSKRNPALIEDIPMVFRGVLANAETDEEFFGVELIVDYESLGSVLASRGISPKCWWTYKNGIECTSVSALPTCPKTRDGCKERGKEWEFGGWEFFEEPVSSPPGSGGDGDGGITPENPCFTQDTLIWTPDGNIPIGEMEERVRRGKNAVFSFNPLTGEIIEDEIERVWKHETVGYFTFGFEHTYLNVTKNHKLLADFGEWKIADDYKRNDSVKSFDKHWLDSRIKRIKWNSDVKEIVWNLKVKRNRTYFANGCAVSNRKEDPGDIILY